MPGLGNGTKRCLVGRGPSLNTMFSNPAFRRSRWRPYPGCSQTDRCCRRTCLHEIVRAASILLKNSITGLTDRREHQLWWETAEFTPQVSLVNDAAQFAITSNGGNNFQFRHPTTTSRLAPRPLRWPASRSMELPYRLPGPTQLTLNHRLQTPMTNAFMCWWAGTFRARGLHQYHGYDHDDLFRHDPEAAGLCRVERNQYNPS